MRPTSPRDEKPVFWVASSKRDLLDLPRAVCREVGIALSVAQHGGLHGAAKPWKGRGPGVLEIVVDHGGDTYRAVYAVVSGRAIYVLHCFKKKSPSGIRTAGRDVEKVRARLKAALADDEARHGTN